MCFWFAVAVIPAGLPIFSNSLHSCLRLNLAVVVHLPAQGRPRVAHARSSYHQESCLAVSVSDHMHPPPPTPPPTLYPSPLPPVAVYALCILLSSRPEPTGLWDDAGGNAKSTRPPSYRSTFDTGVAFTTRDGSGDGRRWEQRTHDTEFFRWAPTPETRRGSYGGRYD